MARFFRIRKLRIIKEQLEELKFFVDLEIDSLVDAAKEVHGPSCIIEVHKRSALRGCTLIVRHPEGDIHQIYCW